MNIRQYLTRQSVWAGRPMPRRRQGSRRLFLEPLETREAPAVSILNGAGSGYAGLTESR